MDDTEKEELKAKIEKMPHEKFLDYYDEEMWDSQYTIEMNDHKDCPQNREEQEKQALLRKEMLRRLNSK